MLIWPRLIEKCENEVEEDQKEKEFLTNSMECVFVHISKFKH